jgi:DNA-binding response OmpR family regulator
MVQDWPGLWAVRPSSWRPDLLVLDLGFGPPPGGAGWSDFRKASGLATTTILLTGRASIEVLAATARTLGALGYLPRPFTPWMLMDWIEGRAGLLGLDSSQRLLVSTRALHEDHQERSPGILVLEDEPVAAAIVMDALRPLGEPLDHALDWMSFRNLVFRHRYAVLVIDLMLPGISGERVARFIQQELPPPGPKLVIHSARELGEIQALATEVQAFGLLEKGCHSRRLRQMVAGAFHAYMTDNLPEGEAGPEEEQARSTYVYRT